MRSSLTRTQELVSIWASAGLVSIQVAWLPGLLLMVPGGEAGLDAPGPDPAPEQLAAAHATTAAAKTETVPRTAALTAEIEFPRTRMTTSKLGHAKREPPLYRPERR